MTFVEARACREHFAVIKGMITAVRGSVSAHASAMIRTDDTVPGSAASLVSEACVDRHLFPDAVISLCHHVVGCSADGGSRW